MRNLILFMPGVILLKKLFGLNGSIASQPVVELILAVICAGMYIIGVRAETPNLTVYSGAVSMAATSGNLKE